MVRFNAFFRDTPASVTVVDQPSPVSVCCRYLQGRVIWIWICCGTASTSLPAAAAAAVVVAMPSSENRSDVGNSVDRLSSTSGRGERRKVKVGDLMTQ